MHSDISNKQKEILNFIIDELTIRGYPPSVREICNAVGLKSTSTVHNHLSKLENKDYIKRDASKPRAIEVLEKSKLINNSNSNPEIVDIPIVGNITAGKPIIAIENIERFFPLPVEVLPKNELFMLKVKGESMINAGILNGDLILVEKQNTANDNDIVVALLEDEATVKRFFKEKNHIRLQPENDFMDPIICYNIEIIGVVIGLFRLNMY